MAKIKIPPYLAWRDGRPRWVPGPGLRSRGWKGRDLHDDDGNWLSFEAACVLAAELNRQVAASGDTPAPAAPKPRGRTVEALLEAFLNSSDAKALRPRTRDDYRTKADAVIFEPGQARELARDKRARTVFAQSPVAAIGKPEVKGFFEYLEKRRGLAMARSAIATLSAAWTWGTLSTDWRLKSHPCRELKLRSPAPRLVIWTAEEVKALLTAADNAMRPSIGDAVMVALFCGQRQGDVLALVDNAGSKSIADRAAGGEPIRFLQSKTGARVAVFAAPPLVDRLRQAEERRRALPVPKIGDVCVVLSELSLREWNEHTFRHEFAEIRAAAATSCPSIADKRFQDLRDTAVTWLARAGATLPEIASITGHSLASIHTILKHYLELGEPMAREAVRKLVAWMDAEGMAL